MPEIGIWKQFKTMVHTDSAYIATVVSSGDEHSIVELLTGDRVRVLGTGTTGQNVYVKNGEIKNTVADLPRFEMTIY